MTVDAVPALKPGSAQAVHENTIEMIAIRNARMMSLGEFCLQQLRHRLHQNCFALRSRERDRRLVAALQVARGGWNVSATVIAVARDKYGFFRPHLLRSELVFDERFAWQM